MSTPDFFRSRLDAMIDLRHPLAVLATKMSWASIEATLGPLFERRSRDALNRPGFVGDHRVWRYAARASNA